MNDFSDKVRKTETDIVRLTDIETQEVSLVTVPANKRRWLSVKDEKVMDALKTLIAAKDGDNNARLEVIKGWKEKADEDQMVEILKTLLLGLSDETLEKLGLKRMEEEPEEGAGEGAGEGDDVTKDGDDLSEMDQLKEQIAALQASVESMKGVKVDKSKGGSEPEKVTPSTKGNPPSTSSQTDFQDGTKPTTKYVGGRLLPKE